MEDSAAVRESARETLRDVDPAPLRRRLRARIDEAWLVPGTLTVHAARRAGAEELSAGLRSRAAAVQLIYEGLALTRQLVHDDPWSGPDGDPPEGDLAVLVADVLVARGAYLLARTEAADEAVDLIRAFGPDQTRRPRGEPGRALEADVFELAAVAGATAARPEASPALVEWSRELAEHLDGEELPEFATLAAHPAPDPGSAGQPAVANEGRTGGSDP